MASDQVIKKLSQRPDLNNTIYVSDESFDLMEKNKQSNQNDNKQKTNPNNQDFEYKVIIHGYNSDEIKFKIEGNDIVIQV